MNPISATLLRTGKILIVAGSENDSKNNSPGSEAYRNAIWDWTGTTQSSIMVQNIEYDVFCSGTALLPDGRPLVIGGTAEYLENSFRGDSRASIYDPATGKFAQSQSMVDGRWYATATTLGDGRIMAFSGSNLDTGVNNTVEIYDLRNAGAGWTPPATAPFTPPLYPRMFLLPNGKVFFNGHGDSTISNAWIFDPTTMLWSQSVATTGDRTYGSAVLLPLYGPNYTPKVMNFGGGSPASSSTEVIDLSAASPRWTAGPSMTAPRMQNNAVLLPNGKVLSEGGSLNNFSPYPQSRTADLYDPATNSMTPAGTASFSRLYHSTALLLPDARVMSMGSNPDPRGNYQPAIEIYTPPYLFDSSDRLITNRPSITSVPSQPLGYGATFSVSYTSAATITSAVLMRPGSATHAIDMDQRLIGLCGPSPQAACTGSGTLSLKTPPNGNIAPPGYYMLFLVDSRGVPSVAKFLQISPYTTTPPHGTITSPASDVTVTAGSAVSFGTSSTAAQYSWVFPSGSPTNSNAQNPGNVVFNIPGTYTVSLTLIDATGNSDPSPATRTITVVKDPDFDISVSPSSQQVLPGQSTSFTVTVSPRSGFSGSVSFSAESESGLPNGVSIAGFSPSTISGGGGSSTLTMNTTTDALPRAIQMTITGTSGGITHTAATTLLIALAAPSNVRATSGTGQVTVSWNASPGATSYHVKRSLTAGGPYTSIGCPTSTTLVDSGLSSGTTYYYVVSAAYQGGPDAGGESADSGEVSGAPGGAQAPAAPTNVRATTGNAKASVNVTWTQSTGPVSKNNIYRRPSNGTYPGTPTATINAGTSYTDSKLTSGANYCYVVSAVNSSGAESAKSAPEVCANAK